MPSPNVQKTVYALVYPETREIVDDLWGLKPHDWYERAYDGGQEGSHLPLLETWRGWSGVDVSGFTHAYPTAGASEALRELIMPGSGTIHVFEGEYEGYARYAEARRRPVMTHDRGAWEEAVRLTHSDDTWFLSNPSGIDGEYWPQLDAFLLALQRHGMARVVLDVSYVGTCSRHQALDPSSHPNVDAVVFSLSKPFGVYKHRIGGVFRRIEHKALVGNKWFNNLFSTKLGTALMKAFPVDHLPKKYMELQGRVMRQLAIRGEIPAMVQPCNVVLLARSPHGPEEYRRTDGVYRFCLTPGIDRAIKGDR